MTNRLDEIRARRRDDYGFTRSGEVDVDGAFADIDYLLAEVDKLKENWRQAVDNARFFCDKSVRLENEIDAESQ